MKIAALDSGLHQRQAFRQLDHSITLCPISNLKKGDLYFFDVVFVPNFIDQVALDGIGHELKKYVEMNGVLIILGATDLGGKGWIPHCSWDGTGHWPTGYKVLKNKAGRKNEILKGLQSPDRLRFHTSYTGHGSLSVDENDPYIHALIKAEDDRVLMFTRNRPHHGSLLVTTLDPDFHSIPQTPGPLQISASRNLDNARQLLRNILRWSQEEARTYPRFRRRLAGWTVKGFVLARSVLVFSLPAGLVYMVQPSDVSTSGLVYSYLTAMTVWIALIEFLKSRWIEHKARQRSDA